MTSSLIELVQLAAAADDRAQFQRASLECLRVELGAELAFSLTNSGEFAATAARPVAESELFERLRRSATTLERALGPVKRRALGARGVGVYRCARGATHETMRALLDRAAASSLLLCVPRLGRRALGVSIFLRARAFTEAEISTMESLLPVLALGLAAHDPRESPRLGAAGALRLSARERQVVELLNQGYTNREIALALGSSANTVRNQLRSVYEKTGVSRRAELVALSLRR